VADTLGETQILVRGEAVTQDEKPRIPVLVVVQGEEIGRRYLLNEPRLILGRDPQYAQLVVPDSSVSGKHVMIQVNPESDRYGFLDLGSRNGTLLNGSRAESGALRDGDKLFVGTTVLKFSFHDAIEEQFHSEMDRLMHVDSLTGLYMRRWFDIEYPKAFLKACSQQRPFSVLMMDMDGLKAVNDTYGHQMGSYCISEAGKIIRRSIGPGGRGARFGGDEFVAYLVDFEIDRALEVAETIRFGIDDFDFRKGEISVSPTISIGVAERGIQVNNPEELARLADAALYRAKQAGRNVVCK
jgi:diguanylate cyclase (GGDEF)-like protein